MDEPVVGMGRVPGGMWQVVVALPALSWSLNPDEANDLAAQIQEKSLIVQDRNRGHKFGVVNGEGSNLRDDAPTERHLRAV